MSSAGHVALTIRREPVNFCLDYPTRDRHSFNDVGSVVTSGYGNRPTAVAFDTLAVFPAE